ncbi:DUF1016 N-terminal domain-containing protein [Bacteroides graminisolvens]|uniref:DUF1016 N-terminal domain-containing protein n=2 Tax=Bacteroides graminisolvens TaxID=477666 RepID=UPI00041B8DCF|nr:DUF1016 N-terminal domain-containing protein [Bacteroides graminisolvens]
MRIKKRGCACFDTPSLPWGHNLLLINKIDSNDAVKFYAQECLQKGWSRDMLINAINMNTYVAQSTKFHLPTVEN